MTQSPSYDELLMPQWMVGSPLGEVWNNAYIETGDANLAMEAVRRSSEYDDTFQGNRREDGSLRYDENTYLAIIESYEDELLAVNVNPDLYRGRFPDLIEGLVSPSEFTTRVESMYESVIESAPEIRDFYAANYGMDMTDSAIVASFLDPDIGQAVLDKRIATSEIGGEAATRGFDVSLAYASSLERADISRGEAGNFFGAAATMVPALSVLAARHADPDDDFDLEEFTQASLFQDPEQRRRMRRLISQESSTFTGGAQLDYKRGQSGGVTGLVQT
jgi:hypothetical protein